CISRRPVENEPPLGLGPAAQAGLLRALAGTHPPHPAVDPPWLTLAVVALAKSINEERRWEDMPVLADALEEAGCGSPEFLGHLGQPRQAHVRGCRCLDLILGKQ